MAALLLRAADGLAVFAEAVRLAAAGFAAAGLDVVLAAAAVKVSVCFCISATA